jgi:hypothetical protein
MKDKAIFRIALIAMIYLMLRFFGGELGRTLLWPISMLVTFLHEFGHGAAAIITGGSVNGLKINPDGSGVTITQGGNVGVILMGGYIGSAVLGNILFYIGAKKPTLHRITLAVLGAFMMFVAIFWFESWITLLILAAYALVLYFIARRANWPGEALMFFGLASVLYIIQDFNVGPSSDLEQYANKVGFLTADLWKYIWLGIVVLMFIANVRMILNRRII